MNIWKFYLKLYQSLNMHLFETKSTNISLWTPPQPSHRFFTPTPPKKIGRDGLCTLPFSYISWWCFFTHQTKSKWGLYLELYILTIQHIKTIFQFFLSWCFVPLPHSRIWVIPLEWSPRRASRLLILQLLPLMLLLLRLLLLYYDMKGFILYNYSE